MDCDEDILIRLYRETYEEYNKTKLANEIGFYFIPNDCTVLQLRQFVKYLSKKNQYLLISEQAWELLPGL